MSKMMNTKKYFLDLVSASIQGSPIPVCPQEVDKNTLYKLAVRNAVTGILYLAMQNDKISFSQEIIDKLRNLYMTNLAREASQQAEIEFIREEFSKQNISFMFLKGTHLKALYPVPQMRFMVDMDVLVRENDMKKGGEIILSRGFTQEMNNGKDIVLIKKPFLTIELHKMLFVEDYFMHDYFEDVWDRAEKVTDSEYKMSNNDLYVYTLAHLCEHYLEAGSCFRPLMDLFLMGNSFDLDFEYINKQFAELGIDEFAKKIKKLCECAFGDGEYDDDLKVMENYIVFGAPVKNGVEASKLARTQKSKSKRVVETLFPDFQHMKRKYSILEKLPILLPIMWLIRIFEYVFLKKNSVDKKRNEIATADAKSVDAMKEIFEKSGL